MQVAACAWRSHAHGRIGFVWSGRSKLLSLTATETRGATRTGCFVKRIGELPSFRIGFIGMRVEKPSLLRRSGLFGQDRQGFIPHSDEDASYTPTSCFTRTNG